MAKPAARARRRSLRERLPGALAWTGLGALAIGSAAFFGYHAFRGLRGGARFLEGLLSLVGGAGGGPSWYWVGAALMAGLMAAVGLRLAWDGVRHHRLNTGLPFALVQAFLVVGLGMPLWGFLIGVGALLWPVATPVMVLIWVRHRRADRIADEADVAVLLEEIEADRRAASGPALERRPSPPESV